MKNWNSTESTGGVCIFPSVQTPQPQFVLLLNVNGCYAHDQPNLLLSNGPPTIILIGWILQRGFDRQILERPNGACRGPLPSFGGSANEAGMCHLSQYLGVVIIKILKTVFKTQFHIISIVGVPLGSLHEVDGPGPEEQFRTLVH